jgi:hypothetical protein
VSSIQQESLVNFLNQGKALYVESVDIGETFENQDLMDMLGFSMQSAGNNIGTVETIYGTEDSFVENLSLNYGYGTELDYSVDELQIETGVSLFVSQDDITRIVGKENGYRAISSSIILGGLKDGIDGNTKAAMMQRIMAFLSSGMQPVPRLFQSQLLFATSQGFDEAQMIHLFNDGLNELEINGFEFNASNGFLADLALPLTIPYADFATIPVTFSNQSVGNYENQLTLFTNQGDVDIALQAVCHDAPQLVSFPETYSVEINQNEMMLQTQIPLENQGNYNLLYSVQPFIMEDVNDLTMYNYHVQNYEYNWFEIAELGEIIEFPTANDFSAPIELSNEFVFYGKKYARLYISPKGFLSFSDFSGDFSLNTSFPNASIPSPVIAPLWDDLTTNTGNVYVYQDNEKTVVQYENRTRFRGLIDGSYTFQVILYKNSSILYQYKELNGNVESCTIGMQNQTAEKSILLGYNESFLQNEQAFMISSGPDWLEVSYLSGQVSPAQTEEMGLTFYTLDYQPQHYNAILVFYSNSPEYSEILMPIDFLIQENGAEGSETAIPIAAKLLGNYPNPFNPSTTIYYRIDEPSQIELTIYNSKGQKIKKYENHHSSSGEFYYFWDGADDAGNQVSSGVYFYNLKSGKYFSSKRMILMK